MIAPDFARLMERAAGLLHADEGRHEPVSFILRQGEIELSCVARLVWRLHEPGCRVVVADVVTGRPLCESLPGHPYDLDRGHDDDKGDGGELPAGASPAASATDGFPLYFAHLVDRAACRLKADGWHRPVSFVWWADGEAGTYTARIDWAPDELEPRVVVFDGRSGEFLCQSQPGMLHEIDPGHWCLDVAPDVVAEYEYRQRLALRAGACGKCTAA